MLIKPSRGVQPIKTHPLQRGLTGLWIFNEMTGNKVWDYSGNINTCTLTNCTWDGQGAYYDGSSAYGIVSHNSSIDIGNHSLSVGVILQVNQSVGQWDRAIYKGGGAAGNPGYEFELGTDNWVIYIADASILRYAVFGTESSFLNKITHLFMVIDRENRKLIPYVNGRATTSGTDISALSSVDSSGNNLNIGRRTSVFFKGWISQVRIYNRALSPNEVFLLYKDPYADFSEE
jgi:hypothetical protein